MRFLPRLRPNVAVIRLSGTIGGGSRIGGAGLNDASIGPLIEAAFRRGRPAAVALAINSPGGSPTQSALIAARIRALAAETKVPVYAFCEDVAASGGYWLATAGDEIYADASSIVGSIGVVSAGFGFKDLIARIGVERRMHTAGESKSLLDPFSDERPEDVARLDTILAAIHENFIAQVRARRGDKLSEDGLFTGAIFVGAAAIENGLIDGIAHLRPKMREIFGPKVRFRELRARRSILSRFGVGIADSFIETVESRALWARFGL